MANNLDIKDGAGTSKIIATTETATVHTPHHRDPEAIAALALLHTDLATTLAAYLDGLETLVGSSNTGLALLHTDLVTTLGAYLDGLEALVGASNAGLATLHADFALATPAGENHVGQVGGSTKVIQPAITVEATPDYSDGDDIFGKLSLAVARNAAGSGYLTRLQLRSRIAIAVPTFLHIFSADPAASTFTKNAAMVLHANDQAKPLKTFAIASGDWVAPKGVSPWYSVELIGFGALAQSLAYQLASGTDLFAALEADGTINFGSADDIGMIVASENN